MNDTEWVACNRRPMGGNKRCSNMRSLIAKYAILQKFQTLTIGAQWLQETWLDSGWKPPNLRDIGEEPLKELRWVVIAHDHISRQLRPPWRLRNPGRVEDDEVKGLLGKPISWAKIGENDTSWRWEPTQLLLFLMCLLLFPTLRWYEGVVETPISESMLAEIPPFLKFRIHSKKAMSVLISASLCYEHQQYRQPG